MIVNALFLNLLSLLVIAGDTFTGVTANELAPNASHDYSAKERQAKCTRGWCEWVCPDDWCWVAESVMSGGSIHWDWLACKTAADCGQSRGYEATCKHVGGGPYKLNCPWPAPQRPATTNKENQSKAQENGKNSDEENRRKVIKCFNPALKPDEVEKAIKDHYHPETPDPSYRKARCFASSCLWSCPKDFCAVADKHTEAGKTSLQWHPCKDDDDCKPDGDVMVCGKDDDNSDSNVPLEGPAPTCPFDEGAHKKYTDLRRWMKCVAPKKDSEQIETDLNFIVRRPGNARFQPVIDGMRRDYYL